MNSSVVRKETFLSELKLSAKSLVINPFSTVSITVFSSRLQKLVSYWF